MENIAAVDIGSNAIRLLIGRLDDHGDIHTIKKVREPVRLGKDVFADGMISERTTARALQTFSKFRALMEQHQVQRRRVIATSAVREAANRDEFVKAVRAASGLKVEIIDGLEEAKLVHTAVRHRVHLGDKVAVLIDIGGGSVELIVSVQGRIRGMRSFKLGTVRLLQMLQDKNLKEKNLREFVQTKMAEAQHFVLEATRGRHVDYCVGTGGNFECLGKLRVALLHRNSIYSMTHKELHELLEHLQGMTIKERIQFLRLRPDRADVVVPAAIVADEIMSAIPTEMLLVPYVGLRDGVLSELGEQISARGPRLRLQRA